MRFSSVVCAACVVTSAQRHGRTALLGVGALPQGRRQLLDHDPIAAEIAAAGGYLMPVISVALVISLLIEHGVGLSAP
jgi:hypothetical protein